MLAKQLTQTAYLLTSSLGHHVALVWYRENVFISTHNQKKVYNSLEEIASEFAEPLSEASTEKDTTQHELGEYPIKHDTVFETLENDFPVYRTKESSNIWFAAGYWVLHNNGAYRVGLSPKVTTLDEHCLGPYKDKFSANVILGNINKRKTTDEKNS